MKLATPADDLPSAASTTSIDAGTSAARALEIEVGSCVTGMQAESAAATVTAHLRMRPWYRRRPFRFKRRRDRSLTRRAKIPIREHHEEDPTAHARPDARAGAALAADGAAHRASPVARVRTGLWPRPRRTAVPLPDETGRAGLRFVGHRRDGGVVRQFL